MSDEEFDALWTSCEWREELDKTRQRIDELEARLNAYSWEAENMSLQARIAELEAEALRYKADQAMTLLLKIDEFYNGLGVQGTIPDDLKCLVERSKT